MKIIKVPSTLSFFLCIMFYNQTIAQTENTIEIAVGCHYKLHPWVHTVVKKALDQYILTLSSIKNIQAVLQGATQSRQDQLIKNTITAIKTILDDLEKITPERTAFFSRPSSQQAIEQITTTMKHIMEILSPTQGSSAFDTKKIEEVIQPVFTQLEQLQMEMNTIEAKETDAVVLANLAEPGDLWIDVRPFCIEKISKTLTNWLDLEKTTYLCKATPEICVKVQQL